MKSLPERIESEDELDDLMTRPSRELTAFVHTLQSPLVVIGAGGKMGPSLCVLASRAAEAAGHNLRVIAVSRFSSASSRIWLEERGVQTIAADVMNRADIERLPDAPSLVYLVGQKFGTSDHPELTWAVNALAPAYVAERYAGSRIAALSTGNVYPLVRVDQGGSVESDPLTPMGEYANAAVARERIFEYCALHFGTRIVLVRLNYAVDLRYGVLVDVARKIAQGDVVDLTMGYLNCIWQRDANDMILRSMALAATPIEVLNLTGAEVLSVRRLAEKLGGLMGLPVRIHGEEEETALLSDPSKAYAALGTPETPIETILEWTAHWVATGQPLLGKPTHFEVRDGRY